MPMAPGVAVVIEGAVAVVPSAGLPVRVLTEGATSHTDAVSTPENTRRTIDQSLAGLPNVHE